MKHILVLATLVAAFIGSAAFATPVTVTWVAPTTCADGTSPLTMCPTTGFEVSEGASQTAAFAVKEQVSATTVSRTYDIPPGTRCFSVKTVSNAQKSDESTRACATIPFLPPKAPAGMTVTVQVTVSVP